MVADAIYDFSRSVPDTEHSSEEVPPVPPCEHPRMSQPLSGPTSVVPPSDRVLRSAIVHHVEASQTENVYEHIDCYGGFVSNRSLEADVCKLTVRTALESPHRQQWIQAMRDEIFSLIRVYAHLGYGEESSRS